MNVIAIQIRENVIKYLYGGEKMEIVKVQSCKTNVYMNLPRETREALDIKKGDKILLKVVDGKLIAEKC